MSKEWRKEAATWALAAAGLVLLVINILDYLVGWSIYPDGLLGVILGIVIFGALFIGQP